MSFKEAQARAQLILKQPSNAEKSLELADKFISLVKVEENRKLVEADVVDLKSELANSENSEE